MKEYYKIGEISKLYNIGPDSLRYYEELGLLNPKRGENGYRLYGIADIWQLNVIRDLRHLRFPMEKIGEYISKRSVETTKQLLKDEVVAIDEQLALLEKLKTDVSARLEILEKAMAEPKDEVVVKTFPKRNCHIIREPYSSDEEMDMLINRLFNKNQNNLYIIGNNRIGSFLKAEPGNEDQYPRYEGVFVIDEKGSSYLEGGTYLSISYHGTAQQHYKYVPMMMEFAETHGYELQGSLLEIVWVDIHQAEDIDEHITELQIRCIKK